MRRNADYLLLTIIVCYGCGGAAPAPPPETPGTGKAIIHEKVKAEVLEPPADGSQFFARLIKTYRDAEHFEVQAEYEGALLAPLDNLVYQTVRSVKPNKLSIDHQDGRRRVNLQSDGSQYGIYASSVRQYVSGEAPKDMTALVETGDWKAQVGEYQLFFWRLLAEDADRLTSLPTISYVDRVKHDEGLLDHGQFVENGWQYDLYSSTNKRPVLVKLTVSPAAEPAEPEGQPAATEESQDADESQGCSAGRRRCGS